MWYLVLTGFCGSLRLGIFWAAEFFVESLSVDSLLLFVYQDSGCLEVVAPIFGVGRKNDHFSPNPKFGGSNPPLATKKDTAVNTMLILPD